ncbi:energy transducer TonB [Psychroserpens sp. SPM9]|uniref:energy transducer TonB n=1 Tax=Psychroserpens sp. SPM9 TaxID=2975598 RepID=UPI0021A7DF0E|nr:energy transducer TonB [Psychroserpens sp. SPM9]MDG5490340.1 energy transducer TonB [Psychroserpens sp. SPM9]
MLHYILQVVTFQALFLIIYDIALRKETFFNLNRVYLLGTAVLSVVIPFIKIEQIKEVVAKDFAIRLPEVIIGNPAENISTIDPQIAMQVGINLDPEPVSIWRIILISGMCVATLLLLIKITKLFWLASKHPKRWKGNILIINLINSTKAFSFFHYIFLGGQLNLQEKSTILEHEIVHVKQKHTLDLLFFELFRIAFWFNPLVYLYQNRIATLHEYIADAKAVKNHNKADYYDNLLAQVFETEQFSFVNPFFKQSLIKKRILMLSKSKSKQIHSIKYALLLPLVFAMLIYTSSYAQEKVESITETITVTDLQELTDKELFDKYYNDIVALHEKNVDFSDIYEAYKPNREKYVLSRDQYYKQMAFFKFFAQKGAKELEKDSKFLERFSKFKPYNDYLESKKTDEAKQLWESDIQDGILRLVISAGKMTDEEKKKFDQKLDLIEKDEFYKGLLVVTEDGRTKMMVSDYQSAHSNVAETVIDAVDEVKVTQIEESIEVPFSIIEEAPTFSFCDALTSEAERKKCMSEGIARHVNKKFNTNLASQLGLVGRQRINVMFKIDKEGHVTGVKARAPHPKLEEEAKRVIYELPQFVPGKQKGKPVIVPYSLPILFQVAAENKIETDSALVAKEVKVMTQKLKQLDAMQNQQKLSGMPFSSVDEIPVYQSCQALSNRDDRKACVSKTINSYVNKNFNLNEASKIGLKGRQRVEVVFNINTQGDIVNVKARASHPKLEEEAIRVVKSLPKFDHPGQHDGQPVEVSYRLPIVFQIAN